MAIGVAIAAAVLIGALAVGDSVRDSLRRLALQRLGGVRDALVAGDRMIAADLADRIGGHAAPALLLPGVATVQGGATRAGHVQIIGVDARFWKLSGLTPPTSGRDEVALSANLAEHLHVKRGDRVLLRIAKPSALPRDVPLGSDAQGTVTLAATVTTVLGDDQMGRFSLHAQPLPPMNAFVSLTALQRVGRAMGKANLLLAGDAASPPTLKNWKLADVGIDVRSLPALGVIELRSERVFIDPAVVHAAESAVPGGTPSLTYLVNTLAANGHETPYSMVTATDDAARPIGEHEVVLTQWLAEDLAAKPGDRVTLRYFVLGPQRSLVEKSAAFTVKSIIPTEAAGGDRELMPEFPGLADVDSTRDWQPGIPIDLKRIRNKDEQYWHDHRGTPKAFVSMAWARKAWGNRFGETTAIRWPIAGRDAGGAEAIAAAVKAKLDPAVLGLRLEPVRKQALAAAANGTDFGGLFVGLSFFLIVGAMLLVGLLMGLSVEQRSAEVGTLLAVGWTPQGVRRLVMREGMLLAVAGTAVGVPLGLGYTRGLVWALSGAWGGAVGGTRIVYAAEPTSVATGAAAAILVAALAMLWVVRKQARRPARELLAMRLGSEVVTPAAKRGWIGVTVAAMCIAGAVALAAVFRGSSGEAAAGAFFGAGAILLIGAILLCRALLVRAARAGEGGRLTLASLGWRNGARRRSRSLATIGMLACGTFLLVAVNSFRDDPLSGPHDRRSGTGGFALFAESTLPIDHDVNTAAGREALGLDDAAMRGASAVEMRLRAGDEASCLNLNAPQSPPLLGVDPKRMEGRFSFVFDFGWTITYQAPGIPPTDTSSWDGSGWDALNLNAWGPDTVPGIVDDTVATWILHKQMGDTIDYTDEHGRTLHVKIVGTLAPSILQGFIIINEKSMERHFPSAGGYRVMLIDAPAERAVAVGRAMESGLEDYGVNTMAADRRLAAFAAVQNTYLTIFGVLGGLGVALGCVGLGVLVMRNVLERRSELATMRAVGFTRGALGWLVVSEHWALVGLGVGCGAAAALVAVVPAMRGGGLPGTTLAAVLGIVAASGIGWTAAAAWVALRGKLVEGLRSE